jgi:hypothetical protein
MLSAGSFGSSTKFLIFRTTRSRHICWYYISWALSGDFLCTIDSLLLGEQTQIVRTNITIDSGTVKYALHWSDILWLCTVLNTVYRRSNYPLNDIFTSPYQLTRSCSNTWTSLTCCTTLYDTTIQHVPLQTNKLFREKKMSLQDVYIRLMFQPSWIIFM